LQLCGGVVGVLFVAFGCIFTFLFSCLFEALYYRIVEWFGFEGTLSIISFQSPCHRQGHLPLDQVAQSPIQPGLEHCQGGGIHNSRQPVPGPHHPYNESFLPYI